MSLRGRVTHINKLTIKIIQLVAQRLFIKPLSHFSGQVTGDNFCRPQFPTESTHQSVFHTDFARTCPQVFTQVRFVKAATYSYIAEFPWVNSNEIYWPFPYFFLTKSQFYGLLWHENFIFSALHEFTWVTGKYKKLMWRPLGKKYYGLIYIMFKYSRNMSPHFLAFLVSGCNTEQWHHDIDSQNVEWGLHVDINSFFPDFFLTFDQFQNLPISKFTDFFLTF